MSDKPAAPQEDDIVTRLRGAYSTIFERSLAREAADEIASLRAQLAAMDAEIATQAARDVLA